MQQEFTVKQRHLYNRAGPIRWLVSHIIRYPLLPLGLVACSIIGNICQSYSRIIIGRAFAWINGPSPQLSVLISLALAEAGVRLGQAACQFRRNASTEFLAQRLSRSSR